MGHLITHKLAPSPHFTHTSHFLLSVLTMHTHTHTYPPGIWVTETPDFSLSGKMLEQHTRCLERTHIHTPSLIQKMNEAMKLYLDWMSVSEQANARCFPSYTCNHSNQDGSCRGFMRRSVGMHKQTEAQTQSLHAALIPITLMHFWQSCCC